MSYGHQPGDGAFGRDRYGRPEPVAGRPMAGQGQSQPYPPPAQGQGFPPQPHQPHQQRPQQPAHRPHQPYVPPTRDDVPQLTPRPADRYAPPQNPQHGPQHGPYPTPPRTARRRAQPPSSGGLVTEEDERWAVPAYIGLFVTGFVAPAIVLLVKGHTSPFARFHAAQALNLFIVTFTGNLAGLLLSQVIGGTGLLIALLVLAGESCCVIRAAIAANRCEWYRLPAIVAWPIVR